MKLRVALALLLAVACSSSVETEPSATVSATGTSESSRTTTPTAPPPTLPIAADTLPDLRLEPAFPGLAPNSLGMLPLFYTPFPGDSHDAVIVDQDGVVYRVAGAETSRLLDISGRISRRGREEGLLGLAFDPLFSSNGYFYVYYSDSAPRRSVLSRFEFDFGAGAADGSTELALLEIAEPLSNHNGGMLAFGPDGYLYVGVGDGGSRGDPMSNSQDPGTLLGTILRIDVTTASAGGGYSIPSDNPFVGAPGARDPDARDEVWAYGIRNPWRFSFDRATGELWLADVGQNLWEEIDIIEPGGNYGWNVMEGFHCFAAGAECDKAGLRLPVFEYGREGGCSITGGYVYRGEEIPALAGAYVYGDFCSGNIWALRYVEGEVEEQRQIARTDFPLASFGEDADGELYAVTFGGVFRLVSVE